ncbi:ObirCsp13 [Ooceraea biroi]|uniref:ObirCsp13 n=1 Tax=Ooceraea biroi TaxID=2015173 RepID=A0A026WDT8_OOCBI|nr:ejaculatory bulb-specific protein 3 [Ooceraea biroi]EZA53189.1 hypothetical protein X777_06268 [Ooceraea biroi]RLU22750.1 ObirCsp13 [Ooceraea biroi]
MARLIVSLIVVTISVAILCIYAEELYSDKYDNTDVMSILNNQTLQEQYYNCVIDAGPCTTDIQKFAKEHILEAIQTNCKKCTEKQKQIVTMIKDWYEKNKPDQWHVILSIVTKM